MEYQGLFGSSSDDTGTAPMTATEKLVKTTWIKVLRKGEEAIIRSKDDFFRLGGDSLSAILLVSVFREQISA
jgi:acyl carrier protein